jgi:hypothetical protein
VANQYDPIAIKSGILTVLGTDTLRADRLAAAGLTITGPVSGDACQVSGALTLGKAVNTSTSPIVGIFDGETNSVVRKGVVVATMKAGVDLGNGDTVWLSSTAGALTNVKPTADMLHEVGVVVDAASSRILLQQKPVIALPPTPPVYIFVGIQQGYVAKLKASDGSFVGSYDCCSDINQSPTNLLYDGTYLWAGQGDNAPRNIGKLNPTTGARVGTPFSAFAVSYGMAFDGVNYWWGGYGNQSITKFDVNGTVLGTVPIPGWPFQVCYDGVGNIWSQEGQYQAVKVRVSDNAITRYAFPGGWLTPDNRCIVSDRTYVYYAIGWSTSWMIYRIKISDGSTTQFPQGSSYYYVRDITFDGANIWARYHSNPVGSGLLKIRVSDGAQFGPYAVDTSVGILCCDGANIWVTRQAQNAIRKFRCSDGAIIGDYGNGTQTPSPSGICSTGGVLPWP